MTAIKHHHHQLKKKNNHHQQQKPSIQQKGSKSSTSKLHKNASPYAPAALLLNQVWSKNIGLKAVAYDSKGELTCSKASYAQCCNVLQNINILQAVWENVMQKNNDNININSNDNNDDIHNKGLHYVLLYELLLGPNKSIRGGGKVKRLLMAQESKLRQELQKKMIQQQSNNDKGTNHLLCSNNVIIPRYVRINTIHGNLKAIISKILCQDKNNEKIYLDSHVPNVFVLPPTPSSREILQPFVESGQVVLQDKSSCFSAMCLVYGFDNNNNNNNSTGPEDYIDACAAPGNKTSHLASLLYSQKVNNNKKFSKSTIFAFDRSPDRYQTLQKRMQQLTTNDDNNNNNSNSIIQVKCQQVDFLQTDPSDYPNVKAIMLDPSCSGSGMVPTVHGKIQINNNNKNEKEQSRLESLSSFQIQALKHAMSFPNVTRIVYSTCSIHEIENEHVIHQVLSTNNNNNNNTEWELVAPKCLQSWKRRGNTTYSGLSQKQINTMIRVDPMQDATQGFFVACLQRIRNKDNNNNNNNNNEKSINVSKVSKVMPMKINNPMNLSFYNGQFNDYNDDDDTTKSSINNNEAQKNNGSNNNQSTKKEVSTPKSSNNDKKNNKKKASLLDANKNNKGNNNDTKIVCKKQAKKLAWKQKQAEQKLQRLKKKQQENKK